MNKFGKVEAVKKSWEILKANANAVALVVGVYVVFYLVNNFLPLAISGVLGNSAVGALISGLLSLALVVVSLVLQYGYVRYFLMIVDGKKPELKDLYSFPEMPIRVLKLAIASFLYGLMVVGGFILLIVPGIYLAIRFSYFSYYLVDKDAGIIDSLKMSWKLTDGAVINLFLFSLLLGLINIGGALLLGLGLLVTIPLSYIAMTHVYRKFQS